MHMFKFLKNIDCKTMLQKGLEVWILKTLIILMACFQYTLFIKQRFSPDDNSVVLRYF